MKLSALVISATRLCGVPVTELSNEVGIHRSALSRALVGADLPPKYFPALCAAVGLDQAGEGWDTSYVGRWYITPRPKRGVAASAQDLVLAITALNSAKVVRITLDRAARSWGDHRHIAIAKAKGEEGASVVYLVSDNQVRRLLYVSPPARREVESLLEKTATLERLTLSDDDQKGLGDVWSRLSSVHEPAELDALMAQMRGAAGKAPYARDREALERVAKLAGLSVPEIRKRLGIRVLDQSVP